MRATDKMPPLSVMNVHVNRVDDILIVWPIFKQWNNASEVKFVYMYLCDCVQVCVRSVFCAIAIATAQETQAKHVQSWFRYVCLLHWEARNTKTKTERIKNTKYYIALWMIRGRQALSMWNLPLTGATETQSASTVLHRVCDTQKRIHTHTTGPANACSASEYKRRTQLVHKQFWQSIYRIFGWPVKCSYTHTHNTTFSESVECRIVFFSSFSVMLLLFCFMQTSKYFIRIVYGVIPL